MCKLEINLQSSIQFTLVRSANCENNLRKGQSPFWIKENIAATYLIVFLKNFLLVLAPSAHFPLVIKTV